MPCCILQHPETKVFVPFPEAAEEAGKGRKGNWRHEIDSQGMQSEIMEMRISSTQIESCLFFQFIFFIIIHYPAPSIFMKLKMVAIYLFPRDHVFKKCILQSEEKET